MILLDETVIFKEWGSNMEKLRKWISNVIKNEWRCRFKLVNGTEFLGIATSFENDKIEVYNLDEDRFQGKFNGIYNLSDFESISTIENELKIWY